MTRGSLIAFLAKQSARYIPFQFLRPIESFMINRSRHCDSHTLRPIFLLGLPRSGTTLAYQCISQSFHLNYLTNIWHYLYKLPCWGGLVSSFMIRRFTSEPNFASTQGFVNGICGQAEGLHFWSYWMGAGLVEPCDDGLPLAPAADPRYLLRSLGALQKSTDPFFSAYLGHILYISELFQLFPGAIFVRLRRDPLMNALSLLVCLRSSAQPWFSVVPAECAYDKDASDHYKVASQVYWLNRRIDSSLRSIPAFEFSYEELCSNPAVVIDAFDEYAKSQGVSLARRHTLPGRFAMQELSSYSSFDVNAILQAFEQLSSRHG